MKIDPSELRNAEQISRFEKVTSKKVNILLKQRIYEWNPIEYTSYVGKQYLIRRMPAEYAALNKIFAEISSRCPDFKPHSLLDFGSGVGTVTRLDLSY